jgi:putative redox protein
VEGARATEHPMIYNEIELVYRVKGKVNPEAIERAIELSTTKYCGVHAMLHHDAKITTRYEIVGEPQLVMA